MLYDEKIEALISAALADGVLTEKEKQILFKKAQAQGIDLDEFEMVLDARLVEREKAEKEKAAASAPKSTKYGDVRKCPVCGAMVPALAAACPECGYEFSGIEVSKAAKELSEKLQAENEKWGSRIKEKTEIIENFAIPNTKAELFGFMISAKPHILDSKDPLARAYFKKYQQCLEQARISLPNDKDVTPYINEFEALKKRINSFSYKWNAFLRWWNNLDDLVKWFVVVPAIVIVIGTIIGITVSYASEADERYEAKIIEVAEEGNLELAVDMYNKGLHKYATEYNHWGEKAIDVIFDYSLKQDIHKAEELYNEYPELKWKMRQAYLDAGMIDDYWRMSRDMYNRGEDHVARYNAMENVVKFYCEQGDIKAAKTFVNKNINWFYTNVDKDPKINEESGLFSGGHSDWKPYKKARVQERLDAIINQY